MTETQAPTISDAAVEAVKRYRGTVIEFQKYWSAYRNGANSTSESTRVGDDMQQSERELIARIESIAAEVRRQVLAELIEAALVDKADTFYIDGVGSVREIVADWLREQGESK